jgi:DNA-binding MarR family transcriptional regulator
MRASESSYSKCMYFASGALARRTEKLAQEAWKPVGLSPSHAYLLMMVIGDPGIQPSAIVAELLLTPSTITRLIEKLEEKKLVHRDYQSKCTYVFPTAKGKALLPQLQDCVKTFYEGYSTVLGKDESAKFVQAMNRITDKLSA